MKDKNMYARAAQNAYNLKHNGWLHDQIKEQKKKAEQEFEKKFEQEKQDIYEQGKKEGFEQGKKKGYADGYERGFQKGWQQQEDFGEVTSETTFLLAIMELYGFGGKRLLDTVEKQNEYISRYNRGDMGLGTMVDILKGKGVTFKKEVLNTAMVTDRMIRQGSIKPYYPRKNGCNEKPIYHNNGGALSHGRS